MCKNKILIFNIAGKFAHFKKYYTNSSSLTYDIPPRTVIMGLLGSVLEMKRNEYYDVFLQDMCKLSVSLLTKAKKHFESINYIHDKSGHTQIPVELLMPLSRKDTLRYRFYVYHKDNKLLNELKKRIEKNNAGFGIYLGQRQFRGYYDGKPLLAEYEHLENLEGETTTVTWADNIVDLDFVKSKEVVKLKMVGQYNKIESGREPAKMIDVIYSVNNKIYGKFKELVKIKETGESIAFFTSFKNIC